MALCWFYSHKLQKIPLVRELSASLLTMAPLIAVWIHYGVWDWELLYFFSTMLTILFTKDVVKDIAGHKGNLIFGYKTVVVAAGKKFVKLGLVVFNITIFFVFLLLYFLQNEKSRLYNNNDLIVGSSISLIATSVISIIGLTKISNKYKWMDLGLKLTLIFHVGLLLSTFFIHILV
jgi:4-hydroxybenzoate polyprenyltransferase